MNYRHAYHAGTFADVVKHVILTALLKAFSRKDTSFCYIDTHAGLGYYDLFSEAAQKTKEYQGGIEKIIHQENPPPIVELYLNCVHRINNELLGSKYASLRFYPGSPMIASHLIRSHDRIIACELQPNEYQILKNTFAGDKQVAVHHLDGFLGLKAFLPPKEKRGLILIDPPYENPDEFTRIILSLPTALKRFPTGVYAIWYPIKEKIQVEQFYRAIKQKISAPVLAIELTIYPDLPNHLNGCGLAILNPPWGLTETLNAVLPWVWNSLTINHQGGFRTYQVK